MNFKMVIFTAVLVLIAALSGVVSGNDEKKLSPLSKKFDFGSLENSRKYYLKYILWKFQIFVPIVR